MVMRTSVTLPEPAGNQGRAIIYARFSPRPDAATSQSIDAQIEECRRWCVARQLRIAGIYTDASRSGGAGLRSGQNGWEADPSARPGLWDAVDACRRGDVLIVARLDRISRDALLSEYVRRTLAAKGAKLVSVAGEGEDETPHGRLVRGILAQIAQYQRELTRARTRTAMRAYQRMGRAVGGKPPYGWRKIGVARPGEPARLEPVPAEQEVLGLISDLRSSGLSYAAIAAYLDEHGYLPRNGGRWQASTIRQIILRRLVPSNAELT